MYIYLMFLIMMDTHFSQSSLQLLSDSIQISIGFIPIKTFCIKCIYYKCIAHHPKKGEKQGPAVEPGVVRISNRVFWVSG